ncbi:MAG: hypothetical protein O3B01_07475 [Planctomycetota bacterium]|nr:hypothetical protein [Planctomycetota bacterium]MDA1138410.1 hypothetical protein [Planctomycetota bacterium]
MNLTKEQLWEFDCKGFALVRNFAETGLVDDLSAAGSHQRPGLDNPSLGA